jgi:hypothetical protein
VEGGAAGDDAAHEFSFALPGAWRVSNCLSCNEAQRLMHVAPVPCLRM